MHRGRRFVTPGPRSIAGLSMVELLVAVAAGLFLVAGILQVLASSRGSYRLAEANARVQENGRFAAQMLAEDLRATRSAGCRSAAMEEVQDTLNVTACSLLENAADCSGAPVIGPDSPIGYDAEASSGSDWLAGLPGDSTSGAQKKVADTWLRGDVLVVWGAEGEGIFMQSDDNDLDLDGTRTGAVNLSVPSNDLDSGDLALLTDCEASDVFVISNEKGSEPPEALEHGTSSVDDEQVNAIAALARSYNRKGTELSPGTTIRARVFPFDYKVYYVCCMDNRTGDIQTGNRVDNCGTDPDRYRPALCRWTASDGSTQQLIADVADMRVTYDGPVDPSDSAISDSSTQTRFLDLPGVVPDAAWVDGRGYWDRVTSARVEILTTSNAEARGVPAAPTTATTADDLGYGLAADRRVYGQFAVTVAIRSHAPWVVHR